MSILYKLYLTRMKANIRHVFSRKGSAIFAILMMLLYGGLIVMSLSKPEIALSMQNITDANMAIMIGVGFTALMVGVMLLQKRKALFMEADAFYLFSGPFTRVPVSYTHLKANQKRNKTCNSQRGTCGFFFWRYCSNLE